MSEQRRAGEIGTIRADLKRLKLLVDDAELFTAIEDWIDASYDRTEADSAQAYIETSLDELLAEWPMYHDPMLEHGTEGFPDACEGCRHYGGACPMLRDREVKRSRERRLAEADSDEEARTVYREQATDVGCHRVPEFLGEYESQHAEFAKRGRTLQATAERQVSSLDVDVDGLDEATAPGVSRAE